MTSEVFSLHSVYEFLVSATFQDDLFFSFLNAMKNLFFKFSLWESERMYFENRVDELVCF